MKKIALITSVIIIITLIYLNLSLETNYITNDNTFRVEYKNINSTTNNKKIYSFNYKNTLIYNSENTDYYSYNNSFNLNNIKQASNIMNENPNYFIQINGYTDYVGDVAYNEKLSTKRTEVIKDILVHKHNISNDRIITNGLGKITEPNIRYRGNRRCDLIIYKIK